MNNPNTAEDYKLLSSYHEVRSTLLSNGADERLERPLAYWTLPSDRRLPLALLGRTISSLLQTPFEQIAATPGIGRKKIHSLIRLLHRATNSEPSEPDVSGQATASSSNGNDHGSCGDFDPTAISEAVWEHWKETVRHHNLAGERLGRLAPSLCEFPTVIWNTQLGYYLGYSLSEIRDLKTHGEKRVRCVLEVFWAINHTLSATQNGSHLSLQLVPQFVARLENWVATVLAGTESPPVQSVKEHVVQALLDQIGIDGGPAIQRLIEGRLGVTTPHESVRSQSRKMGVTRARVYQLLDDCAKIMSVRWPEGNSTLAHFAAELNARNADAESVRLIDDLRELLYPPSDPERD